MPAISTTLLTVLSPHLPLIDGFFNAPVNFLVSLSRSFIFLYRLSRLSFNELILKIKNFYSNLETFINDFNETSKNLGKTVDSFNKTSRSMEKRLEPIISDLIKNELSKDNSVLKMNDVNKKPDEINHLN